jgi:hypothetical protein
MENEMKNIGIWPPNWHSALRETRIGLGTTTKKHKITHTTLDWHKFGQQGYFDLIVAFWQFFHHDRLNGH